MAFWSHPLVRFLLPVKGTPGDSRTVHAPVSDEDVVRPLFARGTGCVVRTTARVQPDPLAMAVWGRQRGPAGRPVLDAVTCTSVPQILTQRLRFAPHAHSLTLKKNTTSNTFIAGQPN